MNIQTDRRAFLKGSAAVAAALVIGIRPDGSFAAGDAAAEINPFVRITPDGVVQVVLKHFEMGQGTTTGLTTLIAEEHVDQSGLDTRRGDVNLGVTVEVSEGGDWRRE